MWIFWHVDCFDHCFPKIGWFFCQTSGHTALISFSSNHCPALLTFKNFMVQKIWFWNVHTLTFFRLVTILGHFFQKMGKLLPIIWSHCCHLLYFLSLFSLVDFFQLLGAENLIVICAHVDILARWLFWSLFQKMGKYLPIIWSHCCHLLYSLSSFSLVDFSRLFEAENMILKHPNVKILTFFRFVTILGHFFQKMGKLLPIIWSHCCHLLYFLSSFSLVDFFQLLGAENLIVISAHVDILARWLFWSLFQKMGKYLPIIWSHCCHLLYFLSSFSLVDFFQLFWCRKLDLNVYMYMFCYFLDWWLSVFLFEPNWHFL